MADIQQSPFNQLLLYCRPGFEKESAAEIQLQAQIANVQGYVRTKPDSGYLQFCLHQPYPVAELNAGFMYNKLVFTRQCVFAIDMIKNLPVDDRVTPLCEHIKTLGLEFNDAYLETPDTNEGKQMSGFCKKFIHPLIQKMKQQDLINKKSEWRLHCFFSQLIRCLYRRNPYSQQLSRSHGYYSAAHAALCAQPFYAEARRSI